MRTLMIGIITLLMSQGAYSQGKLDLPIMQVPDSIAGSFIGNVAFSYFIANDGTIIAWQISSISAWNKRTHQHKTIYQENLKAYYRNNATGKYVSEVKTDFKIKNTPFGMRLAKRLTPWLEEYVKRTRFIILDTSLVERHTWDGNMRRRAMIYGQMLHIEKGKHRWWMHRSPVNK